MWTINLREYMLLVYYTNIIVVLELHSTGTAMGQNKFTQNTSNSYQLSPIHSFII